MAHPYSTVERLRRYLSSRRALDLLDRDIDGREDAGAAESGSVALADDVLERAANSIDAALGRTFSVPFAAITDVPATPGQIADLCDLRATMFLYQWVAPASDTLKELAKEYADYIDNFVSKKWGIPGAAFADSEDSQMLVMHESAGTLTTPTELDSDGEWVDKWGRYT